MLLLPVLLLLSMIVMTFAIPADEIIARVIFNEVRGDGKQGMQACAEVIRNRIKRKEYLNPSDAYAVVTAKGQFDGYRGEGKPDSSFFQKYPKERENWDFALALAHDLINNRLNSNQVSGAVAFLAEGTPETRLGTAYYTPKLVKKIGKTNYYQMIPKNNKNQNL